MVRHNPKVGCHSFSNLHKNIVNHYHSQRNCHLKNSHPRQTSRGIQSCSQDYPRQPKFLDKTVQAKKAQVLDNATNPPSPIFSYPVHMYNRKLLIYMFLLFTHLKCSCGRDNYPSKFHIQESKCNVKYIGANCPQENEDKKQPVQSVQTKQGREGIDDVTNISKQPKCT